MNGHRNWHGFSSVIMCEPCLDRFWKPALALKVMLVGGFKVLVERYRGGLRFETRATH